MRCVRGMACMDGIAGMDWVIPLGMLGLVGTVESDCKGCRG